YSLYTTFGLSGIAAVLGTKSAKTPATGQDENAQPISSNLVLSGLAVLFAVALFVALAQLGSWLVGLDLWLLMASILGLSFVRYILAAPQWLNLLSEGTRRLISKYAAEATKDSAKFDEIRRRLADEFNEALLAYPFDPRRLMTHFPGAIALTGRTQRPFHVV